MKTLFHILFISLFIFLCNGEEHKLIGAWETETVSCVLSTMIITKDNRLMKTTCDKETGKYSGSLLKYTYSIKDDTLYLYNGLKKSPSEILHFELFDNNNILIMYDVNKYDVNKEYPFYSLYKRINPSKP